MFFQIDLFVFFNDNILPFCDVNFDSISGFLYSLLPVLNINCNHVVCLKEVFFADLSATLSDTFCWEGFD